MSVASSRLPAVTVTAADPAIQQACEWVLVLGSAADAGSAGIPNAAANIVAANAEWGVAFRQKFSLLSAKRPFKIGSIGKMDALRLSGHVDFIKTYCPVSA